MSEAVRSRRSDVRFEPQLSIPKAEGSASENPLAELARLVGQDDPFRNPLRPSASVKPEPRGWDTSNPGFAEQQADEVAGEPSHLRGHHGLEQSSEQPVALGYPSDHEDHWSQTAHEQAYGAEAHDGSYSSDQGHVAYDGEPTSDHAHDLQSYAAAPLTPDLWAERRDGAAQPGYHAGAEADETSNSRRAPRRPLVVLASVLILTGGGLAATFLARSGTGPKAQAGSAPTIMAAAGPNKIKLADTSPSAAQEDADSALLNKNGASAGGPVKVVNSQEQPIDLTQLPKAGAAPQGQVSVDATPTGSASPFPQPKKVKTFLVKPDGTMVAAARSGAVSAPAGTPAPAGSTQLATAPGGLETEASAAASAAPRPSTPKTSTRAATTPKAPPTSIADLAAANASEAPIAPSKAVQAAAPGANAQSKSKPIELADASTSDAAAGATGAFALQLAAAPSEQDARSIFSRLQKKYSGELGSLKPTIRKAETGEKSVYRVRVGNLTQDQAKSLCARLQSSGGPCFVVHN